MAKPSEYRGYNFRPTVFHKVQSEIDARGGDLIALHVGDTWFDLPEELGQPLPEEPWAYRLSRYGPTQGSLELRTRLAKKVAARNRLPLGSPEEIQITFGATGALALAMRRLLEPGSEILTLSPYWTILRVVASTARVRLVEVPLFDRLPPLKEDVAALLLPYLSDKTAALYFNSPNNPTGVMLHHGQVQAIARFAREHDLWIFSDEAYEDFVWGDEPYLSIGSLPGMYERTVSIFSMSKSYAAAGLRMGYAAAPAGVIAALNPAMVGIGYEPNSLAQLQWIRGLERHESIVARLRRAYRQGLEAACRNLDVPYLKPDGALYLFLDLRSRWSGLTEDQKLERMLRAGVVMSLGEAFGKDYAGWARFCYTCEPPDKIAEAARRVARL